MTRRKKLMRTISLVAYFIAAFTIFLFLLFPFDRVKSRLESEVRLRTPLELSVSRVSPRLFNRFALFDVVVTDKNGKVLFESPSARATVSLFGLLRGVLSLDLRADAYGGEVIVKALQGRDRRSLLLDANDLDIAAYSPLKDFGFHVSGKIGGNYEISNDAGRVKFWVKNLSSRELKVKGFAVPDFDFDRGWIEGDIRGDRLIIRKLELEGKELKISAVGDMVLREQGALNLMVKLKPSERLAREQPVIVALLKNRDPEGYYQFMLGGTLASPLPRL